MTVPNSRFIAGPATATRIAAVDILIPRRMLRGCHCTGRPQPKPPANAPLVAA